MRLLLIRFTPEGRPTRAKSLPLTPSLTKVGICGHAVADGAALPFQQVTDDGAGAGIGAGAGAGAGLGVGAGVGVGVGAGAGAGAGGAGKIAKGGGASPDATGASPPPPPPPHAVSSTSIDTTKPDFKSLFIVVNVGLKNCRTTFAAKSYQPVTSEYLVMWLKHFLSALLYLNIRTRSHGFLAGIFLLLLVTKGDNVNKL